ncbi:hypothetical protein O0I10_006734 [Lichtheimia ornata]|uniref:F-box domain-containing protein n=1 Tax=Lichtheimia ornata TaxID=688661 RepID=A0AAD7XYI3_9FUNG|nr:uncharacterized protein O0I10_006734 [Lichtheimia ornata]KAJ8657668.1 hypothetical protein O0I10_006734 [Lichtheimia ornata]
MSFSQKPIDFVSELPLEIVAEHIVPRIMERHGRTFNLHGRQNYFSVCTTWSKRIAENDKSIRFNLESERLSLRLDWMRVRAVAPCIKTLTVATRSVRSIFKLVEYAHFSSLRNLTIKETGFHMAWMELLGSLPNLRYLSIMFKVQPNSLQLCDMLDQCTTIVQLRISMTEDFHFTSSLHPERMYPNIRHLQVVYNPPGPSRDVRFIEHFPGLRLLGLTSLPTNHEAVHTIFQYCPHLQQLYLGVEHRASDTEISRLHLDDTQGLRLLSIHDVSLKGNLFEDLMRNHHATLQSFSLQGRCFMYSPIVRRANNRVVFNQLRSLRFPTILGQGGINILTWIVSNAPCIQYVECMRGGVRGEILNALIGRPLTTITLEYSELSSDVDEQRFLDHHVQLSTVSTLQELKCTINKPSYSGDNWLFSIPLLQQLKVLELRPIYSDPQNCSNVLYFCINRFLAHCDAFRT